MLWAGLHFKNHEIATELGVNSQIQIGAISVAIMLLFNFMLVLPIIGTADKIFAKLVRGHIKILLMQFSINSAFFAIVFFIYAAIVLQGKTYIYNYVSEECANPIGYFGDYDRIHKIADRFSCSTECPCSAGMTLR